MPFTPFHLGPGLAIKAMLGSGFSLTLFGVAQVVMDIEPLIRLLRGDRLVHGWTHSYLGATLVAGLVLLLGRPPTQWWLRHLSLALRSHPSSPAEADRCARASEANGGLAGDWFALPWPQGGQATIPWSAACSGALIGCYSHVLLDSLMHGDMRPLLPWSADNPWLYGLSLETLHLFCLGSGLLGMGMLLLRYRRWGLPQCRPGRPGRE